MITDRSSSAESRYKVVADPKDPAPSASAVARTWDSCAGLHESEVPLAELESSIQFDEAFAEPIRYDAARRLLRYRGTMSHASFIHLQGLTRDRQYQRALEQLFVASAVIPHAKATPKKWLVGAGVTAAAFAAVAGGWMMLAGPAASLAPPLKEITVQAAADRPVEGASAATLPSDKHATAPDIDASGSR